jgi:hypothetical protein
MERARRGGWKLCVLDADVDTTTGTIPNVCSIDKAVPVATASGD